MPTKHSALGISSFTLSIITGIIIFIIIAVAGVLEVSTPGGLDEQSTEAVLIGLLVIAALFGLLIALGLGIAGLVQKERKKIFPILGVIFSILPFLGTIVLIVIGLAIDS